MGLHPTPHGRAALEAAARLAALLGVELEAVYVREERLLRLPGSSLLREVDAVSGRVRRLEANDLERQIGAEAARARRLAAQVAEELGVEWSFRDSRGEVARVVRETAAAVDLVILGVRTRSPARGIGSTVRAMLAESGHAVMVIRQGMRLGSHVHAVDDGTEAGRRVVGVARALTDPEGARLTIHVGAPTGGAERAESYREELDEAGRSNAVVLSAPGRGAAAPLAEAECGLLLVPRTALEEGPSALDRLLRHAACPIVVV